MKTEKLMGTSRDLLWSLSLRSVPHAWPDRPCAMYAGQAQHNLSGSGSKGKMTALEFQRCATDKQHHLAEQLPQL